MRHGRTDRPTGPSRFIPNCRVELAWKAARGKAGFLAADFSVLRDSEARLFGFAQDKLRRT